MMTTEEIEAKAQELSQLHKRPVHPIVFETEEQEQIVGWVKEPERLVKFRVLDMTAISMTQAGLTLLECSLLKEESDPRFLSEAPEHDKIVIGAVMECTRIIKMYVNQVKKN